MSQGMKPAHQSRSRKTRDKLLNALEALLQDRDFADIGVSEIAKEAGVSAASIYRRFDKKDGFLPVLLDLYVERMEAWVRSPDARIDIKGLSLREALRLMTKAGWQQVRSQHHILRALYLHGHKNGSLIEAIAKNYAQMTLAGLQTFAAIYAADIKRPLNETSIGFLGYCMNGLLLERGLFPERAALWPMPESDDSFTDEIADVIYSYLMIGSD